MNSGLQDQYTIAVGERLYGTEDDGYYHCFLALLCHTKNDFERAIQKLHFNDDIFWNFLPVLREGQGEKWHAGLTLFSYIEGDEISILPRWNHALSFANDIKTQAIPFDPQRTNCRSGVQAAIQIMGLNFREEFTRSSVGIGIHDFPTGNVFVFNPNDKSHTDLRVMREVNRDLVSRLSDQHQYRLQK